MSDETTPTAETTTAPAPPAPDRRAEFIDGLRQLANALENCPGMPLPQALDKVTVFGMIDARYVDGKQESQVDWMARSAKNVPGRLVKRSDEFYFSLERKFGGITYSLAASRGDVCTRVKVGEKPTTKIEVIESKEVEVMEPVYEYDCAPILSRAAAGAGE